LQSLENVRAGGTVVRNIQMFRQAVGDRAAQNVVIATTKWDLITRDVAAQRHKRLSEEDKFFGGLQNAGARILACHKGHRVQIIEQILENDQALALKIQEEIVIDKKKVKKTGAGQVLEQDIRKGHDQWLQRNEEQLKALTMEGSNWTPEEIKSMKRELRGAQKQKRKEVKAKEKALGRGLGGGGLLSFLTGNN
jgi:hypothetical protein